MGRSCYPRLTPELQLGYTQDANHSVHKALDRTILMTTGCRKAWGSQGRVHGSSQVMAGGELRRVSLQTVCADTTKVSSTLAGHPVTTL